MLARSHELQDGLRVRLRMPLLRDAPAIGELLRSQDGNHEELEMVRLVRFDPRRRVVICATALLDSRETILGVGAIDLDTSELASPEVLVVDGERAPGLDELLERALLARAALMVRGRAA